MSNSDDSINETSIVTLSPNENGENVSNVSGNMKKDKNGIHMITFYISVFIKYCISITWSTTIAKMTTISFLSIILIIVGYWLVIIEGDNNIDEILRDGFNLTTYQTVQIDHKSIEASILTVDDIYQVVNHWNASNPKHTLEIVGFSLNTIKIVKVLNYTMPGHTITTSLITKDVVISEGVIDCKGDFQQRTKETLIWTLYHEIGHLVGLGHTKDLNHLMYGVNPSPTEPFNDLGFNIPNITRFEHTTEREAEISKILNDLESNITEERRKELTNERDCIQTGLK